MELKNTFFDLIRKYSDNERYHRECWDEIENQYTSQDRYYHNLNHLKHMFSELSHIKSHVKHLDTLLFSIFYHDIIYKPSGNDNEHQSAIVLEKRLSKTTFARVSACVNQIEATKDHQLSSDQDTNILLDLDLAILGTPLEQYRTYCQNIKKEYKIYPDATYRKGRKKALQHILALDTIYKTDIFKTKYEDQARVNIKSELDQLR